MIILVLKKMMRMVANFDEDDNDELDDTDDHTDELSVTFEESLLALVDDTQ